MKTLVTGSSGLIGSALVPYLRRNGQHVVRLLRDAATEPDTFRWAPMDGVLPDGVFDGVHAVIHLAGANIAERRWTKRRRALLRNSRVVGTRLLAETLASLEKKPSVLISASGIGYYGDGGDQPLGETNEAGQGFLPELAREWETALSPAKTAGIRTVAIRLGMVLSAHGGALAEMLPLFERGLGARLGNGRQYMSWISLSDVLPAIFYILSTDKLRGPVNLVSPNPVTNAEFTHTLANVLGKPARLIVPGFALRLLLGRMAGELLLASQRAVPGKLIAARFPFAWPKLDEALAHVLEKRARLSQ